MFSLPITASGDALPSFGRQPLLRSYPGPVDSIFHVDLHRRTYNGKASRDLKLPAHL